MGRSSLVLMAGLLLAAWASKPASTPAVVAPRPLGYCCVFEERLLAEHAASPLDSAMRKAVDDYGRERKELAAVHKVDLHCVP
jgi:hypothetical protein